VGISKIKKVSRSVTSTSTSKKENQGGLQRYGITPKTYLTVESFSTNQQEQAQQ